MVRECAVGLLVLPMVSCSWILDFSDRALPDDAPPDSLYSQAECDYGEPNDTPDTAAAITPADTGPAAICGPGIGDRDYYRFTVPAMTAQVAIQLSTPGPGGDLDLRLSDRTGATLAESHRLPRMDHNEPIVCPGASPPCPALAADDYVFEVFPAATGATHRYTFSLGFTAK